MASPSPSTTSSPSHFPEGFPESLPRVPPRFLPPKDKYEGKSKTDGKLKSDAEGNRDFKANGNTESENKKKSENEVVLQNLEFYQNLTNEDLAAHQPLVFDHGDKVVSSKEEVDSQIDVSKFKPGELVMVTSDNLGSLALPRGYITTIQEVDDSTGLVELKGHPNVWINPENIEWAPKF